VAKYIIPSTRKGDTFPGVIFTIKVNGTGLDLTSAVITADFRLLDTGPSALRLTSVANAGFTISPTPANGTFTLNAQIFSIDAGTYNYDINIALSNNTVKTYIWGTFTIVQDVTYDV
jgi:hypothetical protein